MADLGVITEIVNATELHLGVDTGSGASAFNNYILLTNLNLHVGRPEDRVATTDGGALFTYGKGDNWFTATLLLSTGEIDDDDDGTLNKLSQIDSDGDMTSTAFMIRAQDVSGTFKYLACTGIVREYDISKPSEGKVTIDIFVRITSDTVTITDTNPP